jgi:type IX secretion system substrate protein
MRKYYYTIIIAFLVGISSVFAQSREFTADTLSMGADYSNDIYYSFSDGLVSSVPNSGWEIAFYTAPFSAGIIINEGIEVKLYTYPKGDTSVWVHMDTIGMSTWTPMYNSPDYWEDGAFNRNATGHPDYGWGIYNSVNHSLYGDSLYVINIPGVGVKKLWIVNKISVNNMYNIRYADIDGSNEQIAEIDVKPYVSKNFLYYSLVNSEVVDREPTGNWDLLFTKYYDLVAMGSDTLEWPVTGATSNVDRYTNKFYPVADDFEDWGSLPFDSLKNSVGFNWKKFDMSTFQFVIEDSTMFFVMNKAGDVYKLVFTLWEGGTTGKFALNKKLIQPSFLNDHDDAAVLLSVYPNPATGSVSIRTNSDKYIDGGSVIISDLSGREVLRSEIYDNKIINVSNFVQGIYFVTVLNENHRETKKLIIK